jgi:predicted  nucleic acid-binding Zn-ribbon protein
MNDDDLLNFRHTVDSLDSDLTRLQKQVIQLKEENQQLKNLIFRLASAVDRIPKIMDDSSNAFKYSNQATNQFRELLDAVLSAVKP